PVQSDMYLCPLVDCSTDVALIIVSPADHSLYFFFFTYHTPTEIYTLSLHDALPIFVCPAASVVFWWQKTKVSPASRRSRARPSSDRKSTRLNSSHDQISYAVFCLKKKTNIKDLLRPAHDDRAFH